MAKSKAKPQPESAPDIEEEVRALAEKHGAKVGVTLRVDGSKTIVIYTE